jgi:hypothetical protein
MAMHQRLLAAILAALMALIAASNCTARSNVLFIDLNNAEAEINAVKSTLPRDGSRVFTIPPSARFDATRRAAILEVQQRFDATTRLATDCPPSLQARCRGLWDTLRAIELERETLTHRYAVDQMVEDINRIQPEALATVDIVVISGHHSNGYFRGELAKLDINDLIRIDAEFPALFGQVRTVILLGCDTGTPTMFSEVFARLFPLARLMIGSEDSAPTRDEARNLRFIRSLIRFELPLQLARRNEEARRIHQQLLTESWPVAMLWDRQYYFSRGGNGWLGSAAGLRMTRSLSTVEPPGNASAISGK